MARYIEEWKQIKGFEGLYEVSNFAQVRNSKGHILKSAIKKGHSTNYNVVSLYKDGKGHTKTIHRLVAEAFIPNPDNLPCINHKDEDGTNNLPNNLEWCTKQYNTNYGTAQERRTEKIKGVLSACIAGKRKTTGGFMWEMVKHEDFCSYGKKVE